VGVVGAVSTEAEELPLLKSVTIKRLLKIENTLFLP
jgi:hypothetical protein